MKNDVYTWEQIKAIEDIGMAIVKGAHNCSEQIKPALKVPEGTEEKDPENYPHIWVLYEFLYFFMHLTNRHAAAQMNEEQIQRLQALLGPMICTTAVDTFCRHWPGDIKRGMQSEFYTNLNNAEMEYSKCKGIISKESPLTGDALFSTFGRNVSETTGDSMNPVIIVMVIDMAFKAYKEMELHSLIETAAKVI